VTEAERTITTPDTPEEATDTGGGSGSADPGPEAPPHKRRVLVLVGVAALAYLLDLLSKIWVVNSLGHHQPINVLGHYLRLDAIRNAGAAFGLGQGMTVVFTVIAVGVIAVIVRLSRRLYSVPWAIALGLLLGGAMGNLGDRIFRAPGLFRGYVVDWIGVVPRYYPIFNLADSAIVCGGILTVILAMRGYHLDGTRGDVPAGSGAPAGENAEPADSGGPTEP